MLEPISVFFHYVLLVSASVAFVFFTMPSILHICLERKLFDSVGFRKMHDQGIPRLGGLAMFFSFIVTLLIFTNAESVLPLKAILVSCMFVSFVSLKDDLVGVGPYKKIAVHFFVSILLVLWGGIRIDNLHGLLGVHQLSPIVSNIISVFFITYIINAFNLIDGLDGLAASLGLLGSLIFGVLFIYSGQKDLAGVALCMAGALLGFLRYNFSPARIFMGDTGAYLIGIILSVLAIRFVETNPLALIGGYDPETPALVALSALIIPLFDTMRVVLIRLGQFRSPFSADGNHIHHKLRNAGMSHSQVVVTLLIFNLIVVSTAFLLHDMGNGFSLFLIIVECILFNIMATVFLQSKKATRFSFRNFLW